MTDDARFEDVSFSDQPLRLSILSPEDLEIASALLQDAVGLAGEISWMPRRHRLAVLVNRFRWEDRDAAASQRREFERVRTAVVFDSVLAVRASGLDPREKDMVYSILRVSFEPGEDGAGTVVIDLAGDGAVALDVECLDARLLDLSRPWATRAEPGHDLD